MEESSKLLMKVKRNVDDSCAGADEKGVNHRIWRVDWSSTRGDATLERAYLSYGRSDVVQREATEQRAKS